MSDTTRTWMVAILNFRGKQKPSLDTSGSYSFHFHPDTVRGPQVINALFHPSKSYKSLSFRLVPEGSRK